MRPFTDCLESDRELLAYRAHAATSASTTCAKPAGVAVGDVVVVVTPDSTGLTLTTSGGSAWTRSQIDWTSPGYHSVLFCKLLNATDVANGWTFSTAVDAEAFAWIGNDAGGVSVRSTTNNATANQASLTLTGFTPANTQGAIAVVLDRDIDVTPTTPAGFVSRYSSHAGLSNWTCAVADADAYPGGNVVWAALNGASGFQESGWLVEVQGP